MTFVQRLNNNGVLRATQILISVALLVLSPLLISGQNDEKSDSTLLNKANELFDNAKYSEALEKAKLAASGFIKEENWQGLYESQVILVRIEYLDMFSETLLPDLEFIHSHIPEYLVWEWATSSYYIAYIADNRGEILKALNYYKATIEPFKKINDLESLSEVYALIGTIYTRFADYSRASKLLNASAEITLQINDTLGYNNNIFNLALNAFYNNDLEESENLFRQYHVLEPLYKEEVYAELCKIKTAKMELDSARIYLNLAKGLKNPYGISTAYLNVLEANILCSEGDIEEAINYMKRNESEIDSIDNSRDKGKYYWRLANLYSKENDMTNALFHYNKSLQSFSKFEINIDSVSKFRQNNYLFHEIWFGDILIGLSSVYAQKYSKTNDEAFKLKSKECLELALESLDYKRSFFEDIESSFILNKKSKAHYEKAINNYLAWYEADGYESDLDKAFQLTQRHNAFVLRQQINERIKFERFGVDDSLKTEYLNLKLQAVEESFILERQYSNEGFEQLKNTESLLDSMEEKLVILYPQLEASKNDFSVASISDIQKVLNKDRAIIKYFEGVENVYSIVITKNKIAYFAHQNVEEIRAKIQNIRALISGFNYEMTKIDSIEKKFLTASYDLGNSLLAEEIASLPKAIKKLTIVPSGSLTQIPFETLIIKEKDSWSEPNHYLINDYAISYNYFCKALTSSTISKTLDKVLSYGLEYDEFTLNASKKISKDSLSSQILDKFRSEEMGHLYFAADEAREVAAMFDGVSYTNENATKRNFLSNVSDYDIIHLSAHSFVDFQYPSNSAIIFSKKDSLTDNLLQVKDVDRLILDGQLFTLSACNTFFGKNNEGEGLSSMARSFIQSGAGSVIGSFWSVPDEISKSFMVHFYSKLKQGLPKDEALRAAKIDFMTDNDLSTPLYRSPAYWSAWVIYGDTQSIYKSNNDLIYFGVGLIFIIILLLIKFRYLF